MKQTFSKAKVKAIAKHHNRKLQLHKKTEVLLFLEYMMFLKRLANKVDSKAQENKQSTLTRYHVQSVKKEVLKSCKG